MRISIQYIMDCGHSNTIHREYDFTNESDVYKYDSLIQFNKVGNDTSCPKCQESRTLMEFHVRKK